jgi:hypothetical protein
MHPGSTEYSMPSLSLVNEFRRTDRAFSRIFLTDKDRRAQLFFLRDF